MDGGDPAMSKTDDQGMEKYAVVNEDKEKIASRVAERDAMKFLAEKKKKKGTAPQKRQS